MNPWPFVLAAYAVVILASTALAIISWREMRAAERAADAFRRK